MLLIRKDVPLAPLTTFGIGGRAQFYTEVRAAEDLIEAGKFALENKLPTFVLGGGSNLLIADAGIPGLVIKPMMNEISYFRAGDGVILKAGAGCDWDGVVAFTVKTNLAGIENLSLIPGTAGGAVCQNIGAYGAELADVFIMAKAVNLETGKLVELSKDDCRFGYRTSVFKKDRRLAVFEVELKLSEDFKPNLRYPDLAERFAGRAPSLAEVREAVIQIRKRKLPYPDEAGNAGSFFKNPIVSEQAFKIMLNGHPELKGRSVGNGMVKLSAAQLIELCGWKGKRVGNVGVSEKHSLVLVNYGAGTAAEILSLAEAIKNSVEKEFGLALSPEVEKAPQLG